MRVRLDAFVDIPAQPVAAAPVVDRPDRDVRVVARPGGAEDEPEQERGCEDVDRTCAEVPTHQLQRPCLWATLECGSTKAIFSSSIKFRLARRGHVSPERVQLCSGNERCISWAAVDVKGRP